MGMKKGPDLTSYAVRRGLAYSKAFALTTNMKTSTDPVTGVGFYRSALGFVQITKAAGLCLLPYCFAIVIISRDFSVVNSQNDLKTSSMCPLGHFEVQFRIHICPVSTLGSGLNPHPLSLLTLYRRRMLRESHLTFSG